MHTSAIEQKLKFENTETWTWRCLLLVVMTAALTLVGINRDAAAQSGTPTTLINSAQNVQELSVADNIVLICPQLGGTGDLFERCNGAIRASNNAIAGADILGQIAAEEVIAQTSSVDGTLAPQTKAVAARVSALIGPSRLLRTVDASPAVFNRPVVLAATDLTPVMVAQSEGKASALPAGLGGFLTGDGSFGNKDETSREAGYDFTDFNITGGIDYFFLDNLVGGIALGYGQSDVDFDANAGDLEGDGISVSLYSLWYPLEALSLSGLFNFGWINYDSKRNINYIDFPASAGPAGVAVDRTAKGDTDARRFEISGSGYYEFTSGAWGFGPTGRLGYLRMDIDGFSETGAQGLNIRYDDQDADSFQTAFGGQVNRVFSMPFGVLQWQGRGEWVHEYLADSRTISLRYVDDNVANSQGFKLLTDDPDRDRFLIGTGLSAVFKNGISAFADFETVLGHSDRESYAFTAGIRTEFAALGL